MIILVVAIGLLAIAVWNAVAWPSIGGSSGNRESVSILIPARNEERNIAEAVKAALRADSEGVVAEVLVYDDHSEDRTAEVVVDLAQRDRRIRLLPPVPLPPGWCGKPFACVQLAEYASSTWMLFLDADARLERGAPARLVAEACRRGVTLLSAWPALDMRGWSEQIFMPLLNFVVFTLFPAPLSLRRMTMPALGLAHGACLLVRREEYLRTGGHAMVRAELFEDTALARAWRKRGLRSLCLDGRCVVRVRMYDSLGAMWQGFRKILYPAFRRELSFWAFCGLQAGVYLVPWVVTAVAIGHDTVQPTAWAVLVTGVLTRLILAARFCHPWWSVALHPLAVGGMLVAAVSAWMQCHFGAGVEWRGRRYRSTRP